MSERIEIHHLIILDRSSSMSGIKKATIIGFNEIVDQIDEDAKEYEDEQDHFVSLVLFNARVETPIWMECISSLNPLSETSYVPSGMTALNDAIGTGVNKLKVELKDKLASGNARINVTVVTDGAENSSKEFSTSDTKKLIDELNEGDDSPWLFQYIGANVDSFAEAQARGFDAAMNYTSSPIGTQKAFASMKNARATYSKCISDGISKSALVAETIEDLVEDNDKDKQVDDSD